jgi:hypothetical protein
MCFRDITLFYTCPILILFRIFLSAQKVWEGFHATGMPTTWLINVACKTNTLVIYIHSRLKKEVLKDFLKTRDT